MSNWITEAEGALSGQPSDRVEVVTRSAPALFDATLARATLSPLLAAFMWAAAVFRETQTHSPMDPLALLFRLLALGMALRAVNLAIGVFARLRVAFARKRYGLALTDEGLLFRTARTDYAVPRQQVLDVRERAGNWTRSSGKRWAEVFVITHPDSGRLALTLPPLFGPTPGALVEALMRWRGPIEAPPAGAPAQQEPLASKLWERVAQGERLAGVTALRHGSGWLRRGPYASLLLGAAVLYAFLRLPPSARDALSLRPALLLAAALLCVPIAWILFTRASLAPRAGLSFVLTPHALLTRTRGGVQRVAWDNVARVQVVSRSSWSILQGAYESRSLVVEVRGESAIVCAQAFLAVAVDVAAGLCDAYRKGLVARVAAETSDSIAASSEPSEEPSEPDEPSEEPSGS